jgi:cardiolipin synthase A/B
MWTSAESTDLLVLDAARRRDAVVGAIQTARRRLRITLFRCNDLDVLEAIAGARGRGVTVEALVTPQAAGAANALGFLVSYLARLGVVIHRRCLPLDKYHAKYLVVDDAIAIVGSANFTRKCFARTSDFMVVTADPSVVTGLGTLFDADREGVTPRLAAAVAIRASATSNPPAVGSRLVVAPGPARAQLTALLQSARRRIRIIDRRMSDPQMRALVDASTARGVEVRRIESRRIDGQPSHGTLLIVDDRIALIGSLALSPTSLDRRREVSILLEEPAAVADLVAFFDRAASAPARSSRKLHKEVAA